MDLFGAITSIAGSFLGGVGQAIGNSVAGGGGSVSSGASSLGSRSNILGSLASPMTEAKSVSGKNPSKAAPVASGLDAMKEWATLIQNAGLN